MKAVVAMLSAMVLAVVVGCDNKKSGTATTTTGPTTPEKKGVEVNAPGVNVRTGDKADGGGVEVNTPAANVDVNKDQPAK